MRYFWDFVEFINMKALNSPDTIARNYLIECKYNASTIYPDLKDDFVRCGLARLGLSPGNTNGVAALKELMAALNSYGCTLDEVFIIAYLGQFYNWHRLKCGELKRWPKRKVL